MTDTPNKSSNSPFAYLFLIIALGAFAYAALGFIGLYAAQIPSDWPTVEGQVVSRTVESRQTTKDNGEVVETYSPKVTYRYKMGDDFVLGTGLSRHPQQRTLRGVAERELEAYVPGTKVTVHYNPDNPDETVLQKSDTLGPFQAISAGLCIGLSCVAIFIISIRRKKPQAKA